jgi:5-methylcytosine-specific restriction endonuclease McrA
MSNISIVTREEKLVKDAERQRRRRASFDETQCATCGKPRTELSRYCVRCEERYQGYKIANRKGRPAYIICRKCGTGRPSKTTCRPCAAEAQRKIRAEGRKKIYTYTPDGRVTFCEKCLSEKPVHKQCEMCRMSYGRNYRLRTASARREYKKRFWAEHKQRLTAEHYAWHLANREKVLELHRNWRRKNPHYFRVANNRRRALEVNAHGSHTAEEWCAILKKYKNRCADCGFKGPLTEDHIIPLSKGGSDFAYNLKPLCQSCNSRKHNKLLSGVHFSLFDKVEMARS